MTKSFTTRRCVQAAFVLAAFIGAAPAFAQSTWSWSAGISGKNAESPAFAQDAYNLPQDQSQRGQVIVHRSPLYDSTVTPNNWVFDADGSAAARGNSH